MQQTSTPTPLVVTDLDALSQDHRDALQHLLTRSVDAAEGFETMVEKAEPEFRPVAQRFLDLHRTHAQRLTDCLAGQGAHPDAEGGIMAAVNTLVVSVRALFDEIDADVLRAVRRGEEAVLDSFDAAADALPEGRLREDILAMKAEVRELLDQVDKRD